MCFYYYNFCFEATINVFLVNYHSIYYAPKKISFFVFKLWKYSQRTLGHGNFFSASISVPVPREWDERIHIVFWNLITVHFSLSEAENKFVKNINLNWFEILFWKEFCKLMLFSRTIWIRELQKHWIFEQWMRQLCAYSFGQHWLVALFSNRQLPISRPFSGIRYNLHCNCFQK